MAGSDRQGGWRLADELVEAARADTAFADLLVQRARELLSTELTEAQYAGLGGQEAEVAALTNRIAAAVDAGGWQQVRELTGRVADLKRLVSERAPIRAVAARVYEFDEVLVDPFSPGISGLAGVLERDLPGLRDAASKRLERLRAADPAWAELYDARRAAFAGLQLGTAGEADDDATASVAGLRARAQKALVEGDLAQLQLLSTRILEAEQSAGGVPEGGAGGPAARAPPDLVQPFAPEVCQRAAALGLVPERVESTADQVRARFRPAWRPTLGGDRGGTTVRLHVSVPGDTPEALRDTLELLMNRAFVTSAGTRYMPWFVAEDLLVEGFEDPSPDEQASSPLLGALGLTGRRGLGRSRIEKVLRERGGPVVTGLGLDPRVYRLACIPVDAFTRLGARHGWGTRELWTHFDGYMATKERKLLALVGGDVRFGGLHDLVAVGTDYDSERLVARFAIVQRRRFATW